MSVRLYDTINLLNWVASYSSFFFNIFFLKKMLFVKPRVFYLIGSRMNICVTALKLLWTFAFRLASLVRIMHGSKEIVEFNP